jgi:hypothetical protein
MKRIKKQLKTVGTKKNETDDLTKLSAAEKNRYDEIVTIQKYLSDGYAPTTIRELLHTTYNTIRRYAKGNPYEMCRFTGTGKQSSVNTPKYRIEIIDLLKQNTPFSIAHKKTVDMGCNAKLTAFKEYCHKLINELGLDYNSKKNSLGVYIKKNQAVNVHYVSKKDVFEYLWSTEKPNDVKNMCHSHLREEDKTYIFGKYPILEEICYVICDFKEVYVKKDIQLLDNFVDKYSVSAIGSIKSFAKGLKLDIAAVKNSITSKLSNGFVEGNNNKVKLIKRSMFGRAKLALLRAKILLAW